MSSGIYEIVAPSGSRYIGSAVDLSARWRAHRHLLTKGTHFNNGLQRAKAKYGLENLIFRRLLICRRCDLLFFEQRAIDILRPKYNACPIAGSQLGRRHSVESKAKNAEAHRGRRHTVEHRAALSLRMMGNTIMNGRTLSAEQRSKISIASKRPRRTFTADERQSLAGLYRNGTGLLGLVTKYRADHRVIRRALVAEGVAIRARGWTIAQGA